jgi:hypothetical protein
MTMSGVSNTVRDGSLGTVPASVENVMVVFGACSGGTDDTIYSYSDKDDMKEDQGFGPLVHAAAYLLGSGPVLLVPVHQDVAGVAGAVTQSGTGPAVTVAGAPYDDYEPSVEITKAGTLGVAEFQYTLDGDTWSGIVQVPAGGTYAIPDSGMTLTFAAGTYVLDETYTWPCTAPGYSTTELNDAIDAFLRSEYKASLALIVGRPATAAATAALAAAAQSKAAAAETAKRYLRFFIEAADDTDANLLSATINTDAKRVVCGAGLVELFSDVDGRFYKRSAAWTMARRALATPASRHIGRTKDGTMLGITSLHRDERQTAGLGTDTGRFCVLRTYVEKAGYYVEDDYTLAAQGSDFSQLRNGRVMDKALYISDQALFDYLHDDFELAPSGALAEHEAKGIEQYVKQQLEDGLVASKNASAVEFSVSRTYTQRTLRCKTRIQVRPDAKWIEHDIGFTRTVSE